MTGFLFQYQAQTEPVNTSPEQVTESRWHQPLSEPVRRRALAVAIVAASGAFYAPYVQPAQAETVTVDKWHRPFVEPTRRPSGLATADQQFLAFVKASPFAETVSLDRWLRPLSEPRRSPAAVAHQQATAFWPYPIPNVDAPVGYYSIYPDRALRNSLPVADQQTFAFVKAAPFPESVTADRWFVPLSVPTRIRPTQAGLFALYPLPIVSAETVTADKWLSPREQPLMRLHVAALYGSAAIYYPENYPPVVAPPTNTEWIMRARRRGRR